MIDSNAPLPQPGDVIAGKYRVEQVLGAGGMGVVLAARHVALRQAVAVKFLLPQAMKLQGAPQRFLREAQASVAITSEHVARVLDVGTLESGAPYMVMEHLTGTDLGRLLKQRGALPVGEAVDFVLQAGEAIAEAHALGIIHRDLKPSNIFLTRRAEGSALVKVLDFGLSKMTEGAGGGGDHSLTATDVVAGSPDYMSPEQVRSLKNVDGRTDIWALGVVLYELLTTKRPFHGPTPAAICASVAADRPLSVRALRADVSEGLDAAILRCLEKDPASRPQHMGELALALAPFAPGESRASVERIVRLSPARGPARYSGDGSEAVTLPLGARVAGASAAGNVGDPANAAPRPPAASAPSFGVLGQSAAAPVSSFAAPGPSGGRESSAGPAPTLLDAESTQASGPTGGWGQTRPPSHKTSTLAIGGAALAAIVVVVVVGWQILSASRGDAESATAPGDAAGDIGPSVGASPAVAVTPSAAVTTSVPVVITAPAPSPSLSASSASPSATAANTPSAASPGVATASTAPPNSASPRGAPAPVATAPAVAKTAVPGAGSKGPSKSAAPAKGATVLDEPLGPSR